MQSQTDTYILVPTVQQLHKWNA